MYTEKKNVKIISPPYLGRAITYGRFSKEITRWGKLTSSFFFDVFHLQLTKTIFAKKPRIKRRIDEGSSDPRLPL